MIHWTTTFSMEVKLCTGEIMQGHIPCMCVSIVLSRGEDDCHASMLQRGKGKTDLTGPVVRAFRYRPCILYLNCCSQSPKP